jgi:hypothetical protein
MRYFYDFQISARLILLFLIIQRYYGSHSWQTVLIWVLLPVDRHENRLVFLPVDKPNQKMQSKIITKNQLILYASH